MKNKLLSWVLLFSLAFSNVAAAGAANVRDYTKRLEQVVYSTKNAQEFKKQIQDKEEVSTSELIKLASLESCLDFVYKCRKNGAFEPQIKKHGLEKTAEHTAESGFYWVDLAEEYIKINNPRYEIPEEIYLSAAKKIGIGEAKFHKGHTKPKAKGVVRARAKTGEIETEHYIKLIRKNKQEHKKQDIAQRQNITKKFDSLMRGTFTEEEYSKYLNLKYSSLVNYYNELGKTLGLKILLGKKDISEMKKATLEYYEEKKDRIYEK